MTGVQTCALPILPGMALTHLPVPPASIPVRADYQYFSVSRNGPCWDNIVQTRQLGLYVPGDLTDPEVQLLVVLEALSHTVDQRVRRLPIKPPTLDDGVDGRVHLAHRHFRIFFPAAVGSLLRGTGS